MAEPTRPCWRNIPHGAHPWGEQGFQCAGLPAPLTPLPVLPYAGTSGHSGSDTSQERQEHEDSSGTTGKRQAAVLRLVDGTGYRGATVHTASRVLGTHHGQTSAALSNLESAGLVVRVEERRQRCHVYVTPRNLAGRQVYRPPARVPRGVLEARLAAVEKLAQERCETYWSRPDEDNPPTCADDGARSPDAPYGAERYCWPCRIRAALGDSGR